MRKGFLERFSGLRGLKKYDRHIFWWLTWIIACLMLFVMMVENLLHKELAGFDDVVSNFVHSFISPGLTKVVIWITNLGEGHFEALIWAVACIILVRVNQRIGAITLTVSALGGWLINSLLKWIFQRPRPDMLQLVGAGWYSFPSGHAMVAAAFYSVLGYLIWMQIREKGKKAWYVPLLTVLLVLSIGLSRVYLRVHYPSDVLAGFAVGSAWGALCIVGFLVLNYNRKTGR